jgi:DNA processing protein
VRGEAADVGAPSGFPPGFGQGPRERDALLLLCCLLGTAPRALHAMAWASGSAGAMVDAIRSGRGGSDGDRRYLRTADAEGVRRALRACGGRFVTPLDEGYPPLLLRLADPPLGLFVRGAAPTHVESVAVVGSRRPSALGREVATELAAGLAGAGVVVVSGGAVGIDAAAHRGALRVGGTTLAVLGSGIDRLYPRSNVELLREIERSGSIVSEYPPGVPAEPHRFPARNRIIAALSRGVVVVEGARRSGTRITADHAIDIGADVFAVPGPVTSPLAETPLELIREGAILVRGAEDLLEDLGIDAARNRGGNGGLPADERAVFEALDVALLPEAVAERAGIAVPHAVAALIRLELRGLVRGVGGRYERTFTSGGRGTEGDG